MLLPWDMSNEYQSFFDNYGRMACERRFVIRDRINGCIRLEKEIDPILSELPTSYHVLDMISSIRSKQNNFGKANLYERCWIDSTTQQKMNVESLTTTILDNDKFSFSVAQFNSLAEGLSAGSSVKTPFPVECAVGEYGGFTSIPNPEITLDFQHRKWRILEAILGRGTETSSMFDVIAIQEMDRFYGFFEPILSLFGYNGIFVPKINSPGLRFGWYSDGCCLFWKRDKFEMISYTSHNFLCGGSQVFLIVCMKHIVTQQPLIFATTHLKSKNSEENENLRQQQVLELVDQLDKEECRYRSSLGLRSEDSIPIIVLGDFNADPPIKNSLPISTISRLLQHNADAASNLYASAYNIDNPDTKDFTTWKIREKVESKRIIDYIFFRSSHIRCVATLQIPDEKEIELSKLPGLRYPSDHMLIGAQFLLNREVSLT
jgi:Endonuclease/Exonuclease/phosphatase family